MGQNSLKVLVFQGVLCYNESMKNDVVPMTSTTADAEYISVSRAEYERLREEYDTLRKDNAELNQKLDFLMGQLRLAKKKMFGTSSEQAAEQLLGQLSFLFNEAEAWTPGEEKTSETTTVAAHTRQKRSSDLDEVLPEGVAVEVVEHGIPKSERVCSACGTVMEQIGKEVRRTLVLRPAAATIREDVYYTYACRRCSVEAAETPILKAERIPPVISGSYASPEAIAHIMVQKFVMASPLYRQEQELNRSGIRLSRQTMSNWILRGSADWLTPVYEEMKKRLVREKVLHADETTLQVLREPGKSAQSKSYMWLYRTGKYAAQPMILYEYRPDRKASNAETFLREFSGWLHADGYPGYHRLPEQIRVVGCWAHLRRKFDEAVKSLPQKDQANASALQGQAYCSRLFSIERELSALPPEERYTKRLERSKPVMDALLAWAFANKAAPKSALGRALYYLEEQWPYLIRVLEDGRLELSNNLAERSIKPFVIGRKNFLFANTPRGAQGSAVIYSMIETAKANGLDPYRYLTWMLTNAPVLAASRPDWPARLLPERAPKECRASPGQDNDI